MTERRIIGTELWKETLCGCCSDLSTCCYGSICTACLFGETHGKTEAEAGCCSGCCGYLLLCPIGFCCLMHKPARIRFREAYGLAEGSGCSNDFCATCLCSCCGVCQEARERKTRGPPAMITTVAHPAVSTNQPL